MSIRHLDKDKDVWRTPSKNDPCRDLRLLRHFSALITFLIIANNNLNVSTQRLTWDCIDNSYDVCCIIIQFAKKINKENSWSQ